MNNSEDLSETVSNACILYHICCQISIVHNVKHRSVLQKCFVRIAQPQGNTFGKSHNYYYYYAFRSRDRQLSRCKDTDAHICQHTNQRYAHPAFKNRS